MVEHRLFVAVTPYVHATQTMYNWGNCTGTTFTNKLGPGKMRQLHLYHLCLHRYDFSDFVGYTTCAYLYIQYIFD